MYAIKAEGVTFSYDSGLPVIQDISFEIAPGDFVAVAGPNGAGKSTLIKTIIGILHPEEGTVSIAETLRGRIGYMPQKIYFSSASFPATVREVVATGILLKKRFPRRLSRKDTVAVNQALELLQIEGLEKKRIGELSGGQQQRVFLARAFASNPAVLILDEPTGALDPHTRGCFYTTLKELNQTQGTTILMVTHDTHSLKQFAEKVLFVDRQLVYYGSIDGFEQHESNHSGHYFQHSVPMPIREESCRS